MTIDGRVAELVALVVPTADHPLRPTALFFGVGCFAVGLWFFAQSHAGLGADYRA